MSSLGEHAAPVSLFTPGTVLGGKFEIRGVIGEGGMGVIYDATQLSAGRRRVAVKVLHDCKMRDARARERFRLEAQIVAHLQHPNIVTLHDFGTEDDLGYLVFEYLSGRPLAAEHGKALNAHRTVKIARQICRGLQAAHAAGIVHRDLKPANVFLIELAHEPDFTKILDFGIAKSLPRERDGGTRLTGLHQRLGTLRYMAPEQIRDDAVDHRADLYALGCLVFEMLTGSPPFTDPIGPALVSKHLIHPPPRFHDIRPDLAIDLDLELESITKILLQKQPEARYQSASEVESAFEEWAMRATTERRTPATHRPDAAMSAIVPGGTMTDPEREMFAPAAADARDALADPLVPLDEDPRSEIVSDPLASRVANGAVEGSSPPRSDTRAERPRSYGAPSIRRVRRRRWIAPLAALAVGALAAAVMTTFAPADRGAPQVVRAILPSQTQPVSADDDMMESSGARAPDLQPVQEANDEDLRVTKPTKPPEPRIRIRNVRVEHGSIDAAEISSILKARSRDVARCFERTQPPASKSRTLRLGVMSSEGSTTIRALPNDAASERFSDCIAALDPPIPLPVSRTRAIYFFFADVGPGATP